jgi:hypothetical protein
MSIESYGDLSAIPPPPPSYDGDSDNEKNRCNISVGPCGSKEENSLSDRSDSKSQRDVYYEDDEEDRFMFGCSYDEHVLGIDGDSDASGEIQLDCVMSPIWTTTVDPSNKTYSFPKKEDPLMHSNIDRPWRTSERIDPPARNTEANGAMHQCFVFFGILEIFALRCAFDHLRQGSLETERKPPITFPGYRSPLHVMNPHSGRSQRVHSTYTLTYQRRNQALLVHRRVLEKVLRSWQVITVTALKLRQNFFLMMIVNRWKLYADECLDLRQKRYTALIHWAKVRCKKSFAVLKLHAKQSKDEKRLATVLQRKSILVGLSNARDASCIDASLRLGTTSDPRSKFLNEYRGPAVPSVPKAAPKGHPDHRVSLARNWFDNNRSPFLQSGPISTLTSSMRRSSPSLLRDFRAQTAQTLRPPKFAFTNYCSVGMPSPFLTSSDSNNRQASVIAGSSQRFTHRIGQPKPGILFLRNTQGPTQQAAPSCFGKVQSSARSMKDYYHERFLIASVLDDMISMIEHRHMSAAAGASFRHNNHRF